MRLAEVSHYFNAIFFFASKYIIVEDILEDISLSCNSNDPTLKNNLTLAGDLAEGVGSKVEPTTHFSFQQAPGCCSQGGPKVRIACQPHTRTRTIK